MWRTVIDWSLSFIENMNGVTAWLFKPIHYDSVFSALLERYLGIDIYFRPVDVLGVGFITAIFILLLIKVVNFFS